MKTLLIRLVSLFLLAGICMVAFSACEHPSADGGDDLPFSALWQTTFEGTPDPNHPNDIPGDHEQSDLQGLTYEVNADGNTCKVTGISDRTAIKVVIPEYLDGYRVVEIGASAFDFSKNLVSITIPKGVQKIGTFAFHSCEKLVEVYNLSEHITVEKGSTENGYVGAYALDVYTSADDVSKVDVSGDGFVFYEDDEVCYLIGYTGNLSDLILPTNINFKSYDIYQYAFRNSQFLETLEIPNGVVNINKNAFANCTKLSTVIVSEEVQSIGEGAFSGCSALKSMTLPFVGGSRKSATDTYQYPFGYVFGSSSYYGGVETKQYYYGSSVGGSTYAVSTYYVPQKLQSVTITGGEILRGAFGGCEYLTSIVIPDNVTVIGESAFNGCHSLTFFTIPNQVTRVEWRAFQMCSSLVRVIVGESVEQIYADAFHECRKIVEIYNLSSHITITPYDSSHGEIAYNTSIVHTSLNETSVVWIDGDFVFYQKDNSIYLIGYVGAQSAITLPEDWNGTQYSIYDDAFRYCERLTSITIPKSVTDIGQATFYGCTSLKKVNYTGTKSEWENITNLTYSSLPENVQIVYNYKG